MKKKVRHSKRKDKEKEIKDLKKEIEEYKARYLRAVADYRNLEKRVEEEKSKIRELVYEELVLKLLPFIDDLEKAEVFIKNEGLRIIKEKFQKILKEIGIKEIELLGKKFDPRLSEAIEVVEGDKNDLIVEVLRKGYWYKDRLLRPAQVRVTKKKKG